MVGTESKGYSFCMPLWGIRDEEEPGSIFSPLAAQQGEAYKDTGGLDLTPDL